MMLEKKVMIITVLYFPICKRIDSTLWNAKCTVNVHAFAYVCVEKLPMILCRLNFVCVHCLVYIIPAFLFKLSFPLAVIVEKTLDQWQVDTSLKLMRGSQFFCLVEFNSGS